MTAWTVRLTAAADEDFRDIVQWTKERFGQNQARLYANILLDALVALSAGPTLIGVRARDDIGQNLKTFHVPTSRRRGRHFIIFRVASDKEDPTLEILRVLHESMDFPRHLPGGL